MIPKIIHYCWFGSKEIPATYQEYMKSWKTHFPDYEVMCWNESNLPPEATFLKLLLKYRKWSFLSDFMRFYALYNYGGIYFDTDIEVVKPFPHLLKENCFIGFQHNSFVKHPLNAAVFGAQPKHEYVKACFELITDSFYNKVKPLLGPEVVSRIAVKKGLTIYSEQYLGDTKILTSEAFYPYHWKEEFTPECVKENTFCIHWWQYSWRRKRNLSATLFNLHYKLERSLFILKHKLIGRRYQINR